MVISIIFAQQTKMQSTTGCRVDKNSDIILLLFSTKLDYLFILSQNGEKSKSYAAFFLA
jgi:hypothetical protein